MNKLTYVLFHKVGPGRVRTSARRGGHFLLQFCCKFTSVSVYQKLSKYNDKVSVKIKGCNCLPNSVYLWLKLHCVPEKNCYHTRFMIK